MRRITLWKHHDGAELRDGWFDLDRAVCLGSSPRRESGVNDEIVLTATGECVLIENWGDAAFRCRRLTPPHAPKQHRRGAKKGKRLIRYENLPKDELTRMVMELERQMKQAAKALEFEKAAGLRDQVIELRKALVSDTEALKELAAVAGRDGMVPYSERPPREVSYRPNRRGARYRR